MMKHISLFLFAASIMLSTTAQDRLTGHGHATRSEVIAQNGMACTSQPLATQIAIDILKKGGNAIDAAIAANAALGLMEPTGCGIGGDLFAIVWDAESKQLYGLNGSGRSPQTLSIAYFKEHKLSKIPAYGPLPVSVPGCVDAWFELHQRFGSLSMQEILNPAITYAENGFPLSELIAYYWKKSVKLHAHFPNVTDTYTTNGTTPSKGDIFKNPYLADTYKQLAKQGRNYFYTGAAATIMADFIHEQGGHLSMKDLANHRSEWVKPVSINYRGYDIWELPPNGQGIAALQMLNIIKAYNFKPDEFASARHLHIVTEAKKMAFEDRAQYYADMDAQNVPVKELISEEYANKRRALIDSCKAGTYSAGKISEGETIYLTVADQWGNMVSLIQSNYRGMGSGMVPPKLGFMLQNRGELFSLNPEHANALAPGKRPFHTIIPAFVTKNNQPVMSFGVMGGDFQPQGHVQVLMNIIDFGMNIQEAGDAPRFSHRGSSDPTGNEALNKGQITIESGIPTSTIMQLTKMGHSVGYAPGVYGGYQAIWFDQQRKIYIGASESRKDGMAAGY